MGELLLILISTSLVNNLVLDFMLGTDPTIAVSKNHTAARDLSMLMLVLMPFTALITYVTGTVILRDKEHLLLITLVLLTAVLVVAGGLLLEKIFPRFRRRLVVLTPMVIVNCMLLGLGLLAINLQVGIAGSFFYGLGAALGFSLVLMALNAIREKVSVADIPKPFRGVSILLLSIGLISMAFMGFNGIYS